MDQCMKNIFMIKKIVKIKLTNLLAEKFKLMVLFNKSTLVRLKSSRPNFVITDFLFNSNLRKSKLLILNYIKCIHK